jgi:tRNA(adenine34) deaminase
MVSQHSSQKDSEHMQVALALAHTAFDQNEVPIGAVVTNADGEIIGRGFNQVEGQKSQCAHAEMIAIQQAAQAIGDWRLDGCTLYVTLEPCSMCYSLIRLSRLETLVFGAASPRFGYQLDNVATSSVYKNDVRVVSGVCAVEAQFLLKQFFHMQRMKKGEYKSGSEKDQSKSY